MGNILDWIKSHALISIAIVIGVFVVFNLLKQKTTAANTTTSTAGMSGLATDANGNPIVYRDVADQFVNVSKVQGSYNTAPQGNMTINNPPVDSSTTVSTPTVPITQAPNPTQPGPSAPPAQPAMPASPVEHPTEPEGVIRLRFSQPSVQSYDQNTPGGVPVRQTPGGRQIGLDPYGAQVPVTGAVAQGPSNLPGTNKGSNYWVPTDKGYVSAFDFQQLNASSSTNTAIPGGQA